MRSNQFLRLRNTTCVLVKRWNILQNYITTFRYSDYQLRWIHLLLIHWLLENSRKEWMNEKLWQQSECPAKWSVEDGRFIAAPAGKCRQWTRQRRLITQASCGWIDVCRRTRRRRRDGKIIFTSGRRAGPMLTQSGAEWPRFSVPAPQPWLEAFSLRAGSRAEDQMCSHRLIFLTCTCPYPTLQEAREQPLIERPRSPFFHFPRDVLNKRRSVSRPLSAQDSLEPDKTNVLITAGG